VLDPPGVDEDAEQAAPAPVEEDKTWVDSLWEFLTGADLSS
jgi:hypothetical protein